VRLPDRAELGRWNRQTKQQANGCILFVGEQGADGYGRLRPRPGDKVIYAHIYSWQLANRTDVPTGMQVDHMCHTAAVERGECDGGESCPHRRCVNPAHLEVVSASVNTMRQKHANRGKTECPKGHPLSGDNLVTWSDGKRRCRECLRSR
jgi:hypothetical protein